MTLSNCAQVIVCNMNNLIIFASLCLLAETTSAKVITIGVVTKNAEDTLTAAISQLEVDIKDVLSMHLQTYGELKKTEEKSESQIADGKRAILEHYKKIQGFVDEIKQQHSGQSIDACVQSLQKALINDMLAGQMQVGEELSSFNSEHYKAWVELKEHLRDVENSITGFHVASWLCNENDEACFNSVLKDVEKASNYINGELKQRVGSQLQAVSVAGHFLEKALNQTKSDLLSSMNTLVEEFKSCVEQQ